MAQTLLQDSTVCYRYLRSCIHFLNFLEYYLYSWSTASPTSTTTTLKYKFLPCAFTHVRVNKNKRSFINSTDCQHMPLIWLTQKTDCWKIPRVKNSYQRISCCRWFILSVRQRPSLVSWVRSTTTWLSKLCDPYL